MGSEESPLPCQIVQNDDGVDVFETLSGHRYEGWNFNSGNYLRVFTTDTK